MRSFSSYRCFFFSLLLPLFLVFCPALAQEPDAMKPTYMTARLFVVLVPGGKDSLTDQVFRLRTAAQTDDEKWANNVKKAYPEAVHCALLRTQQIRMLMVPKPSIVMIGDPNQPHMEVQFLLAQGLRDDDTINMTAITDVNFYAGSKSVHPVPMSMANQGFEVNPGMTYFFTNDGLRLKNDVYSVYFRERSFSPVLHQFNHFLVVSLSVEPDRHPPFAFDANKSVALQGKATKKVEPQWPDDVTKFGFFGHVQVKVDIGADGKVVNANVWESTLPEGNLYAVAAAKQWEFPPSELAGINAPASALLTFTVAPPAPPKAPPQQASPTGAKTKPAATKAPVKRRKP